jgi:hypothetical protein
MSGEEAVVAPVDPQQAERERRLEFFKAIAADDQETVRRLLTGGIDPDADLIPPVPKEFLEGFEDERIRYFLASEPGFTALMLATSLGNEVVVRELLDAGASINKLTKRHRTFALWLAGKYGHVEIMRLLMRIGPDDVARQFYIAVDLTRQRATVYRGMEMVMETPISSGRSSHPTPRGWFVVTDKYKDWVSTLYRAKMPYFLRLSCSEVGLHGGVLPGYPASHGCIRLPQEGAKKLYGIVPAGTLVGIQ